MTSLDVLALRAELSPLVGGYVDKAFGGNPFSIRFSTESGKRELTLYDGLFAFLTSPLEKDEGSVIGPLASMVRRKLDNSRVTSVLQQGFDRLLTVQFSRPEGMTAVMELMGKGNFILLDEGKVLSALRYEKRKGHEITPGSRYSLPSLRFDVLDADFDDFLKASSGSRGDIVRTLATVIGLGGDMAEEVCTSAGVEFGTRPESLGRETWTALHTATMEIIRAVREKPEPTVYYEDGRAVQFTPVPFVIFEGMEKRALSSLSECIFEFVRTRPVEIVDAEADRISRLVEKQKEAMDKFRHEMEVTRSFADSIYADYDGFRTAFESMRKGKEAPFSYRSNPDGSCSITVSGVEIRVIPGEDINRIASSIYDMSKEQGRKLKRAEEALAALPVRRAAAPQAVRRPEIRKSRKRFWFDSFRWFLSSEGCLVIAGRDARSNDSLVSKHLSDSDRYAHADVYGAPSVVIKWNDGAGERTLEEACAFALCFSRAWNAQIGAAPAYWVMPDQVSKTPESGEYLPRGAFIIRGRRNYFSKLPLELAVAAMDYEGEMRVVCAPVTAVEAHADEYHLIRPGDRTKESLASELAPLLGVTKDEIVSVLPPGKFTYTGPARKNKKRQEV